MHLHVQFDNNAHSDFLLFVEHFHEFLILILLGLSTKYFLVLSQSDEQYDIIYLQYLHVISCLLLVNSLAS